METQRMSREPYPMMEICPENSRYAVRWDSESKEFHISRPKSAKTLFTLDYETGRYVYAMLRGQARIEEMARRKDPPPRGAIEKDSFMEGISAVGGPSEEDLQRTWRQLSDQFPNMPSEWRDPAITHRRAYLGREGFVRVEDAKKRSGLDEGARRVNLDEECHDAANGFIEFTGREPIINQLVVAESPGYEQIAEVVRSKPLPQFLEIATTDPAVNKERKLRAGTKLQTHSFIVLGESGGEFVCFEKVGLGLPWRLSTLREIHDMHERDFKVANQNRPKIYWTLNELPKVGE